MFVYCILNNLHPAVDTVPNHVKPYWPSEGIDASDEEEPNAKQKLKVETKVNVELHQENQANHSSEIPQEKEDEGQQKENKPLTHQNHQPPEQRKGIREGLNYEIHHCK